MLRKSRTEKHPLQLASILTICSLYGLPVDMQTWSTALGSCRGAAKAGKRVLHIDTADFYGSHWASHQLDYFEKWCRMHASSAGPLYSNAEVYKGIGADLGASNEYNIDLAPKVRAGPYVPTASSRQT